MGHEPVDNLSRTTPDVEVDGIARQLIGELRCINCGYDLRGLSIRVSCPECEMPVRATILSIVDPQAEQLAPLSLPRLTAIGMQFWSIGALIAVLMVWVLRLSEITRDTLGVLWNPWWIPWVGLGGVVMSGLGALAIIRPHQRIRRIDALRAAFGVAAYAPLFLLYNTIYLHFDIAAPLPLLNPGESSLTRSLLRLMMFVCVAIILIGLRPNAVSLAVRSVVIRTGRIDRQSMLAVLASFGVAAFGDAMHILGVYLGGGLGGAISALQIVFVSLGSVLLTVGLVNVVMDTVRLYPIIAHTGVGLSDIMETNTEKNQRSARS